MTKLIIDRESIERDFGSNEAFDQAVADFQQARIDHASTEGEPAPTAHKAVETVVLNYAGKYEIADLPDNTIEDRSKWTIDQIRSTLLSELANARWSASERPINWNGLTVPATRDVRDALVMHAMMISPNERYSFKIGVDQFVELNAVLTSDLIAAIRDRHQHYYDIEAATMEQIKRARTKADLNEIDVRKAFE